MAVAAPAARGLSYAVDIVFCIDVTGSMTPILDKVKANALRFYDDVQSNLTDKGKNVDELRVRVIAFRDFGADGATALHESPFFALPASRANFSDFVDGLVAEGGGDAPESGLEAVALAINSPWTTTAAGRLSWSGPTRWACHVIWAGDSRGTCSSRTAPGSCPPTTSATPVMRWRTSARTPL